MVVEGGRFVLVGSPLASSPPSFARYYWSSFKKWWLVLCGC